MSRFKTRGRKLMPSYEIRDRAIYYCSVVGYKFISLEESDEGYTHSRIRVIDIKGKEKVVTIQCLYNKVRTSKPKDETVVPKNTIIKQEGVFRRLLINKWKKFAESVGYMFIELVEGSIELSGSKAMLVSKRTKMSYIKTYEELL